jgi:hypothetical protein
MIRNGQQGLNPFGGAHAPALLRSLLLLAP